MFKVESDFDYKGYRCVVIFTDGGWRCGYVGLPPGHPLYRKECYDYLQVPKSAIEDEAIGKRGILPLFSAAFDDDERVKMDLYFNVHGGLTYSDGRNYPVESDLWWLGFDCAHYGDGKDLDLVEEYWGDEPRIQIKLQIDREYFDYGDPVRSNEYVQQECMSLVDQIIDLIQKYPESGGVKS